MGLKWTFICSKFSLYPSMSKLRIIGPVFVFKSRVVCQDMIHGIGKYLGYEVIYMKYDS